MIKLGKKLNLSIDDRFRVSYGTTNIKNPTSVYLQMTTWIKPNDEYDDYNILIKKLTKNFRNTLNISLQNSTFDNRKWIVDLDLRSSGMAKDKKSFMSIDTTLFYHEPQDPFAEDTMKFVKYNCSEWLKVFTNNDEVECFNNKK
jgi:hypothetical protein